MARGKGFSNLLRKNKLSVVNAKKFNISDVKVESTSTPEALLIASCNIGEYDTEVYSYRNHEIIIRKPNAGGCYEAFIGDTGYPVKGMFNNVHQALDEAEAEVDALIRSIAGDV